MHDKWSAGDCRYFGEESMALLDPDGDNGALAAVNAASRP
jgi:hypothetical protein